MAHRVLRFGVVALAVLGAAAVVHARAAVAHAQAPEATAGERAGAGEGAGEAEGAGARDAGRALATVDASARPPLGGPDAGVALAAPPDAGAMFDAAVPDDGAVPPIDGALATVADASAIAPDASLATTSDADATDGEPAVLDADDTDLVIRTVLGLGALVLLVWLASHPFVRRVEEALGIRQVVTSGLVFVALGAVARLPVVGILNEAVLEDLAPFLHFALGWIGFVLGFQLDVRMLDRLPRGTALTVAIESAAPFALVALAFGVALVAFGEPIDDPLFLRHALTLGAAGCVSVVAQRERPPLFSPTEGDDMLRRRIDILDEIVAVGALALLGAFFRPRWVEWRWELPGTVWLFLTLGLGVAAGLLVYVMARERGSVGDLLAIVIGSVALSAGIAGYLYLSPIVICFLAGTILSNLPSEARERLWDVLTKLERPTYYVLLVVAGALWDLSDWRGFVLVPVFVGARALGSFFADRAVARAAASGAAAPPTTRAILRPLSAISLAIVVSAQAMYRGQAISWIVTAVIGGAIVTEAIVQLGSRFTLFGRSHGER